MWYTGVWVRVRHIDTIYLRMLKIQLKIVPPPNQLIPNAILTANFLKSFSIDCAYLYYGIS